MTARPHLDGLPEATRQLIIEEARRRVAASPAPTPRAVDAVERLVRLFRIANAKKGKAA
jgi:hypothetical protein